MAATKSTGKRHRERLQRETVVRTALVLLDAVGLDGLTIRVLADHLGVQNPALYWHFKNKQELLDEMAVTLLRDAFDALVDPDVRDPAASWEELIAAMARGFRDAMMARRDGSRVIASADLRRSDLLLGLDQALRVLIDAGFAATDALAGTLSVFDYTLGATFEEQADPVKPKHMDMTAPGHPFRPVLDDPRMPTLAAVLAELFSGGQMPAAPGFMFEAGLRLLLDGLRTRLPARGTHPPSPRQPPSSQPPSSQRQRPRSPRPSSSPRRRR